MFVLIDFCSAANRAHQRTSTTLHHNHLLESVDYIIKLFDFQNLPFFLRLYLVDLNDHSHARFHSIALVYLLLLCLCVDVLIKGANNKAAQEPMTEKQTKINNANEQTINR